MKIWESLAAFLQPRTMPLAAEPVCVQDGSLRAYIWPVKDQYSYEVVTAAGEKIGVGAQRDLVRARDHALGLMSAFRKRS